MIIAAEAGSNLPVVVAVIAALAAVAGTVVTALVALTNIKPSRKKTTSEADKLQAEATYQGGSYIKELSEAATQMMTPLRAENQRLLEKVKDQDGRITEMDDQLQALRQDLRQKDEERDTVQFNFETKLREMARRNQEQVSKLNTRVAELQAELEAYSARPGD